MIQGRTVLIVDQLCDTREVLRTVLQSVGLRTMEAERTAQGLELAQRHQPDLVVLDAEEPDHASTSPGLAGDDSWGPVPVVVLGRATLRNRGRQTERGNNGRCYLPKPFQYVDLINKIEELLSAEGNSRPQRLDGPVRAG